MNDKLDSLKKKRDQLNACIKKEQSKENMRKRKMQTQAKILLGSALINRINSNDEKAMDIYQWCKGSLTEKDRIRLEKAFESLPKNENMA